jgi:hypothetical protein
MFNFSCFLVIVRRLIRLFFFRILSADGSGYNNNGNPAQCAAEIPLLEWRSSAGSFP